MKRWFCIIIVSHFSLSIVAQNDTIILKKSKIGVVAADKMNVVYRGILNPISISAPGVKSFIASGLGLKIIDGKYYISPGQGLETIIKLNIVLNDNSEIIEEHKFRIKGISSSIGLINGLNCSQCIVEMTKEQLKQASISIKNEDFLFDYGFQVKSFVIYISNKKSIKVLGDKINDEAFNEINKLKKGSVFTIGEINFLNNLNLCFTPVIPIKVIIVDKEIKVNYYESKEFIKDSLHNLRIERRILKKQSK